MSVLGEVLVVDSVCVLDVASENDGEDSLMSSASVRKRIKSISISKFMDALDNVH